MTHARTRRSPTVTFWGAAQSVTGSMHLVEAANARILLDCGLVLGFSSHAQERNRVFPFEPNSLDAVILSHAHIDHCGNLPNLVRQGYAGPIYCTPPTRDLLRIMLADSARIQEDEARIEKISGRADESTTGLLYTRKEVERTLSQCVTLDYDLPREIRPGVQLRFVDAGHLLGSAMIGLTLDSPEGESHITFTGDLGRAGLKFLRPPAPMPAADLVLCESTYGGRTHQSLENLATRLQQVVRVTMERDGKLLVPAFSLGRAQVVVHYLRNWMAQGILPTVPIYVDSPLAADIAEVYKLYPESMATDLDFDPESGGPIHYIRGKKESMDLARRRESCVLVASGGMCEAGRILNHLEHNLDDPRNSVVLVSYQAPGSLGRKLLERGPTATFRGRRWNKWADVIDLNGFSGHADRDDLLNFFRPLVDDQPCVRLVHGELDQAEPLARSLKKAGIMDVAIPRREETVSVA